MNKRTRSISILVAAVMLISLLVAFPAFTASAADTNYALKSAGASYTIVSLDGSGAEADPTFLGNGNDSSFTALNDGVTNLGEVAGKYAGFTGTGKYHRVKFDLGATKNGINKIVLQNMVNNYANGGNRGYVLAGFKVYADGNVVTSSATEAANGEKDSYEVTITFNAVNARTIWVDMLSAVYVMTVDEVQIWASESVAPPTQSQPKPTETTPAADNGNYALKASYVISTLGGDGTEGDPAWLNATTTDSSYKVLNDGKTGLGEIALQSVALMGTGKTHRFKFDLKEVKTDIGKIVLKNMVNSANVDYNGSPAGNRGYVLNGFKVQAGASAGSMSNVTVTATEKDNGSAYSYEVTLQFAAVDARFIYIDAVAAGYVLDVDEIEIWGGEAGHVADPKFDLDASAPEKVNPGQTFDVTIEAKNIVATNGIVGVDFVLTFDAEKVTPVYTTDSTMVANFFAKNPSNRWEDAGCYYNASASQYNIRFADKDATTAYGIKADNTLVFKVAFTVKDSVAEGTIVKFAVKDVIGTDPGDASYNGFGDVDGNGDTVTAIVEKPAAPTQTTTPPVTGVIGDIDGDGEANSLDATMALKYDAGLIDLDDTALALGDVDGDGEVGSLDATFIFKYDAGLIDEFPVEA